MSATVERLLAHFRQASERMRELPFYNPALRVELVGWRPFREEIQGGVLITPWCLNLIWIPAAPETLPAKGECCILALNGAEYEGVVAQIAPDLCVASAPLLSETLGLEDQPSAVQVADEVISLLLGPQEADTGRAEVPTETAPTTGQPPDPARRALFRRMLGGAS